MLLLKLLFSQALSYCRINPELKEKWKTTHTLLGMERCYVWEGDAEESTNMEEESPDLSVPY